MAGHVAHVDTHVSSENKGKDHDGDCKNRNIILKWLFKIQGVIVD